MASGSLCTEGAGLGAVWGIWQPREPRRRVGASGDVRGSRLGHWGCVGSAAPGLASLAFGHAWFRGLGCAVVPALHLPCSHHALTKVPFLWQEEFRLERGPQLLALVEDAFSRQADGLQDRWLISLSKPNENDKHLLMTLAGEQGKCWEKKPSRDGGSVFKGLSNGATQPCRKELLLSSPFQSHQFPVLTGLEGWRGTEDIRPFFFTSAFWLVRHRLHEAPSSAFCLLFCTILGLPSLKHPSALSRCLYTLYHGQATAMPGHDSLLLVHFLTVKSCLNWASPDGASPASPKKQKLTVKEGLGWNILPSL